jgi:hypothetical protein
MGRKKLEPLGRPPTLDELWHGTRSKIEVDDNGCWIWDNRNPKNGYGPYRRLYERYVGTTPEGHDLHHVCHNGSGGCCNPAHLEVLPQKIHITQHWEERVDQVTVARIKQLLKTTFLTHDEIAEQAKVAPTTVSAIATGQRWPVEGEVLRPPPRLCEHCGAPVVSRRRSARFCSRAHQAQFNDIRRYRRKYPNAKHRATTDVPIHLREAA